MPRRFLLAFFALLLLLPLVAQVGAVEIACHRGANEVAPENTYAAAEKCIEWGADYVEIDVRTSKDGVLVIMHDPTVNRTTSGKGFVRQLTAAELTGLDAGTWFDPKFADQRVPRLDEYLRWIKGKAKVYFDVKDADLKQLIDLVYETGFENDSFFWFGNNQKAVDFRNLDKKLVLKMNAASPAEAKKWLDTVQANMVEVTPAGMTPDMIKACHDLGLKVMVYEPAKNLDTFRRAIELGADMINLNHADAFIAVRKEVAGK